MSGDTNWTRRDLLGGAALFAFVVGVPAAVLRIGDIDPNHAPTERQAKLIAEVAEIVIPRTDTPGARDVGVDEFLILAFAHGLSGTRAPVASGIVTPALQPFLRRDGSLRYLEWLERTLDKASNGDFFRRTPAERNSTLAALDAETMARGAPWSPWVSIKGLILLGYYTSEAGGSKELRYELVPGRFDPNIPMQPGDRAWSSDWSAVEFG